ncbi:hypothetical protein BD324DRAFT_648644 [Kockovaella imperatae]|uniref:SAP domain-containing protein n=1 Tax=Kockovaella imperatae TaxID=4999 RepID=A0A1Y1UPY5_9TREE|nr:hypothetical protein BD324DRAFT_648644 [Kockovaella imperatae]ORX40032.1 hypothetical protein BD324DRAFT_648644 [Kockovaella imperatae]
MLRRKVSNGLLRATKSNSSLRATAQTQAQMVPPLPQTANFSTLIAKSVKVSEREWGKETVVTLKQELKMRGLPQTGKKADLVERLTMAGKAMPAASSSSTSTSQSSQILSKTAPLTAPKSVPSSSQVIAKPTAPASTPVSKSKTPTPVTPAKAKAPEMTPKTMAKAPEPVTPTPIYRLKGSGTTPSRATAPGPPQMTTPAAPRVSKMAMPPPSSFRMSTASPRLFSTSVVRPAAKKSTPEHSTVLDDHVVSTGPSVSSQKSEAPKAEKPSPEEVTTAPGLPKTKSAGESKGLNVKMPDPRPEPSHEQTIPLEPDNFKTAAKPKEEQSSNSGPKVMTVASASTHHAGGPSHAIHESADPTAVESSESLEENNKSSERSEGGTDKDGQYRAPERELNDEERRGLYIMGGIVGLGWLIGGPKKDKKKKKVETETKSEKH